MKSKETSEFRVGLRNTQVAIVGRPNVGKSTLFNIMTDSRKSVVMNQPGVTRDIIIEPVELWGKEFDLIDTGGITESADVFSQLVREQVTEFLMTVDLLVVVMDGRVGLCPEDRDLIKIAKNTGRPFMLVINKVDKVAEEEVAKADFYEFGMDCVSASFEQRRGISDVLEWIHKNIPEAKADVIEGPKIAMVGKPNVGKSSLCNSLLGQARMLVSDVAGTTIDSVDAQLEFQGKKYVLIDTAGLRKSARRNTDLEVVSAFKSQDSIRRADIVLLVIDAVQGPTEQDAKILEAIVETHKGLVVVANKSDLAEKERPDFKKWFREKIDEEFHFFKDVPVVFTSALHNRGLKDLFSMIEHVYDKLTFSISTNELNEFFLNVIRKAPSPVYGTKNVKFYYLTQTRQKPPAFIAFANHPDGVTPAYRRFLINNIKEKWDLHGIPIRIFVMKSHSK